MSSKSSANQLTIDSAYCSSLSIKQKQKTNVIPKFACKCSGSHFRDKDPFVGFSLTLLLLFLLLLLFHPLPPQGTLKGDKCGFKFKTSL